VRIESNTTASAKSLTKTATSCSSARDSVATGTTLDASKCQMLRLNASRTARRGGTARSVEIKHLKS
jgi:hypothetical protein